mmetsp:Transcript_36402/g.91944  ORF Transcript_36402/g.91944 Transcript_36402/m.91944 type:complete len:87 (+) Transcript_36402:884-1144(+)
MHQSTLSATPIHTPWVPSPPTQGTQQVVQRTLPAAAATRLRAHTLHCTACRHNHDWPCCGPATTQLPHCLATLSAANVRALGGRWR